MKPMFDKPRVWSQSYARRALTGGAKTANPLPAAAALIGGVAKLAGGSLGRRLQSPEARHRERVARTDALAARAVLGDKSALAEIERLSREFATQAGKDYAAGKLAEVRAALRGGGKVAAAQPGLSASDILGSPLGTEIIRATTRRTRSTRARTTTRRVLEGYDEFGAPVYRTVRSRARKASIPRGALPGAGVATAGVGGAGTVAGAGTAAVAGVVIGGLAVGLLIGTGLRRVFGEARAVRAEEAATQGALVLRDTRAQLEAQLGRKLNRTETRALFDEYAAQLVRLGFTQDPATGQWRRTRSRLERLLG